MPRHPHVAHLLVVLTAALAGCESGQFGSDLATRPRPRVLADVESVTIRFPEDQPFSIAVPRSSQQPSLEGKADATCTAERTGAAQARASVETGGIADAVFQLGHAVENATDRQADYTFTLRYRCRFEASASQSTAASDAAIGLHLYVRSHRGRLMRDVTLEQFDTSSGDVQQSATREATVTVTLAPGEAVSVFLAGQARVDVPEERSASAMLAVDGLEIQVTTQPAPPSASLDVP